MLKKPSTRRKSASPPISLNLVPMLDALVSLIVFMLYTMTFLAIVGIESPAPVASTSNIEEQLKEKPLQLTLTIRTQEVEIWSPFDRIAPVKIANTPEGVPDMIAIHKALINVKQKFPLETKIVLVPYPEFSYDVLVALVDSVRFLDPTDPVFYLENKETKIQEETDRLFPEIIFGNLIGGA